MAEYKLSYTGDQINAAIGRALAGDAYNLLDNSDFRSPVNQRNKTTYTGTGYTIDRWRTNFSGDSVEVTTDGVKNTVASTTGGWHLHQIIDNGASLVGSTITAACHAHECVGSLYLLISCRDSGDAEIEHTYVKITTGVSVASMTVPSGTEYIRVGIYAYASSVAVGDRVTLQWIALYEGAYNADILPAYRSKGYAVELATCRRYFKRYVSEGSTYEVCLSGYITSDGKDVVVGIPGNMRIKPSVTVNGLIAIRDDNGYVIDLNTGYANPIVIASGNWRADWATIYFRTNDGNKWGGVNNTLRNVCLLKGSELILSADL